MPNDIFNLSRFIDAQEGVYAIALAELRRGRKQSHWIWFVLPQLKGLGSSSMSQKYGISGLAEAQAYMAHPVLGPRLIECIQAILGHRGALAEAILGEIDALKFKSCLTLFLRAAPDEQVFIDALQCFFKGRSDSQTESLLGISSEE